MSKIKELYYDYSQTKEYAEGQTLDQRKTYDAFEEGLKKTVGEDFDAFSTLCDLGNSHAAECECMGFVMGFKYAMNLMKECFS